MSDKDPAAKLTNHIIHLYDTDPVFRDLVRELNAQAKAKKKAEAEESLANTTAGIASSLARQEPDNMVAVLVTSAVVAALKYAEDKAKAK